MTEENAELALGVKANKGLIPAAATPTSEATAGLIPALTPLDCAAITHMLACSVIFCLSCLASHAAFALSTMQSMPLQLQSGKAVCANHPTLLLLFVSYFEEDVHANDTEGSSHNDEKACSDSLCEKGSLLV